MKTDKLSIDDEVECCKWLEAAKLQKLNEVKAYGNEKGLQGFYDKGCLPDCNGYKKDCDFRFPPSNPY